MIVCIGDHYGLDDADRCPDCGHMPGCWCLCCDVPGYDLDDLPDYNTWPMDGDDVG